MNNKLKNNKGITLAALTITVIILLIVTNIIIYNVKDNLGVERLRNMQNDIEQLSDKISTYYSTYGKIPAITCDGTNNVVSELSTGRRF